MLAAAGAVTRIERSQHRIAGEHAGADIDNGHAVFHRCAVGLAGNAHQAGLGLQDKVVTGQSGLGSDRAVTGNRTTHHARRIGLEPVVVETPLLQRADLEVLDQHVGLADQPGQHFLTGLHRHVQRDRSLVAVDAEVVRRFTGGKRRPPAARVVARAGRFDLDHIGAHVTEHHRAQGAREDARQIKHANASQGALGFCRGHVLAPVRVYFKYVIGKW